MAHKDIFAKSVLYSAIIASLYTVSENTTAGSCPPVDETGNIHVSPGMYCSGDIRPDEPVNDIGVEGLVDGNVFNNHGINDFWMNGGAITGSYINNGSAEEAFITNGSEIFNDIRNYGQMDFIRIDDGPGKETVVYGSVINEGSVEGIGLSGEQARVDGDILNAADGDIGMIDINDGATVGGDVRSDGELDFAIVVDGGASVEGSVENASDGFFGIGIFRDANIGGDVVNSGSGLVMTNTSNARIEGSMINRGSIDMMEVADGATVVNDLLNEGTVNHRMELRDGAVVEGDLHNSGFVADGIHVLDSEIGKDLVNTGVIEDGIGVVDGSRIGGSLVNEVDGVSHGSIEVLDQVTIDGNIENQGIIAYESDKLSMYAEYLPREMVDIEPVLPDSSPLIYEADLGGIRIGHQTTVTGKVINSGSIDISVPEIDPPPPGPAPMFMPEGVHLPEIDRGNDNYILELKSLSGISVSNQSSTGELVNTGNISVHAGLDEPFWLFDDGMGISVNGIAVRQGSVVEGITNEGSISADTYGIFVDGEGVEGSTRIEGSILNVEGASIESGFNGIFVDSAEVTGSVINGGDITSLKKENPFSNGIHIKDSLVGSDVRNDGTIRSGVEGILIDGAQVKGSLINQGEVIAESDGLYLNSAATVEGNIESTGAIRAIRHDGVDISDSNVNGSIILSGSIEAGDNGIEIDGGFLNGGEDVDGEPAPFLYSVIGKSIINSASITNVFPEGEEYDGVDGGDGFDMDFVEIGESLINSGAINVSQRGFDIEDVKITSDFDNSGTINAGKEGIRIRYDGYDSGAPDDIEHPEIGATEIGGNFKNSGAITAVDTGILLEQVSIGGDFDNIGAIESAESSAIDIRESSIAGDFINTGNLTANADLFPEEGEYYSEQWDGMPSEDGEILLTSMGIDSNGDAWFRIRNENTDPSNVYLDEYGGDFVSENISVAPGEEVYINTGKHDGSAETHRLFNVDSGSQLQVKASGQNDFSPEAIEAIQRGISLTGNTYVEDGLLVGRFLEIGGDVINSGNIGANDEGIYIEDADIGGSVVNSGEINAGDVGIEIRQSEVDGSIVNLEQGVVNAGGDGIRITGVSGVENIINVGTISAGNAESEYMYGDGLLVTGVEMNGLVANTGSITAETLGIALFGVDGATGLENTGEINAHYVGMLAVDSEINGNVINGAEGVINAVEDGVVLAEVDGITNVANSGAINAERRNGIALFGSSLDGQVSNSGSVNAGDDGIVLVESDGITDLVNTGSISAQMGSGISLYSSSVDGQVVNAGSINAGDDGMVIRDSSVKTVINSGEITAGTVHEDGYIHGNGIAIYDVSVADEETLSVQNSVDGLISAKDDGIQLSYIDGNTVVANAGTVDALEDGIDFEGIYGSVTLQNSGLVTARQDTVELNNSTGDVNILNTGELLAENEDGSVDVLDFGGHDGDINIINEGSMVASGTSGGVDVFDIGGADGNVSINNSGIVESISTEGNGGNDALDIHGIGGSLTIANEGLIASNTVGGGNDALDLGSIDGDLVITNTGTISATGAGDGNNAFDIGDVDGDLNISNSGDIRSSDVAIKLDSDSDGVMSLVNEGTITSTDAAAIEVSGIMVGQITNYGVIDGGIYQIPEEPEVVEEERGLDYSNAVAIDYRFADSALNFLNGQSDSGTGSVEGDIYGSSLNSDVVEFAAGQYSNNIYDVENINITGLVGLTGNIFSLDNSSLLNVVDTGTLSMSSGNQVNLEGSYSQQGDMALVLNQNTGSLTDPILNVTGDAELDAGSVLRVSVEDRDLSNINSGADSQEVHLIHAGEGLTDNGLDVQSDSILFNYEKFERASSEESGEEFGLIASINNLGDLAAAAGADNNVINALNSLQGEASAGLETLKDSNPDLYDDIYDSTQESLAALGSTLLASPENGIVASQGAQNEALNTILARIAELRSGVSGISAGDEEASDKYRPDALWLRAIYSDGKQDAVTTSDGSFNAYTLRSTGFTIGMDKDFTDNLTLGAGFSHATSTVNEQASAQSAGNTETSSYLGSLYATWRNLSYFVDATFNYGISRNDLKGAGWEADFDANQIGINVMAGKGFLFNDNDTLLEPQIGLNYTRLDSDSYSYNNGVNVNVGAQTLEAVELGAGLRLTSSFEVGGGVLLPEASLMMWHDFSADSVSAELEFETAGGSFVYFGPEGVKNRYQAGVGLEYLMDNNVTLSARYDRNWQSDFGADTWTLKMRYDF